MLNTSAERTPFQEHTEIRPRLFDLTATGPVLWGDGPPPPLVTYAHVAEYAFDGGSIRMASDFVMACTEDTGRERWRLKLSAHLYTPLEFIDGAIVFGTAGNGGGFHCVDLTTGEELYRVPTGGTEAYSWWGAHRILLIDTRRTTALVAVHARTGAEVERWSLGRFQVRPDSPRLLADGMFYATAFAPDRTQWLFSVDLTGGQALPR